MQSTLWSQGIPLKTNTFFQSAKRNCRSKIFAQCDQTLIIWDTDMRHCGASGPAALEAVCYWDGPTVHSSQLAIHVRLQHPMTRTNPYKSIQIHTPLIQHFGINPNDINPISQHFGISNGFPGMPQLPNGSSPPWRIAASSGLPGSDKGPDSAGIRMKDL